MFLGSPVVENLLRCPDEVAAISCGVGYNKNYVFVSRVHPIKRKKDATDENTRLSSICSHSAKY